MKKYTVIVLLAAAVLLTACGGSTQSQAAGEGKKISVQGGKFTNINPPLLQTMLLEKDFVFINVHVPYAGDIPETDLSIPYDQIEQNLDKLPEDKDAKIVIYCRSGSMSRDAVQELVRLGYTNIWNLEGGFNAWERAGLPLIK